MSFWIIASLESWYIFLILATQLQAWRLLHDGDPAWFEGGLPQHEFLRSGKLLAAGELHRSCRPAAVARPYSAGEWDQGREGEQSRKQQAREPRSTRSLDFVIA